MQSCQCYQIGGPFIAEDPDCPAHGIEGQRAADEAEHNAQRVTVLEAALSRLLTDVVPYAVPPENPDYAQAFLAAVSEAQNALS